MFVVLFLVSTFTPISEVNLQVHGEFCKSKMSNHPWKYSHPLQCCAVKHSQVFSTPRDRDVLYRIKCWIVNWVLSTAWCFAIVTWTKLMTFNTRKECSGREAWVTSPATHSLSNHCILEIDIWFTCFASQTQPLPNLVQSNAVKFLQYSPPVTSCAMLAMLNSSQ